MQKSILCRRLPTTFAFMRLALLDMGRRAQGCSNRSQRHVWKSACCVAVHALLSSLGHRHPFAR
eukprot:6412868-Alexandrium_andersonii.AAC.1